VRPSREYEHYYLVDTYKMVLHARNLDYAYDSTFVILLSNKTGMTEIDLIMAQFSMMVFFMFSCCCICSIAGAIARCKRNQNNELVVYENNNPGVDIQNRRLGQAIGFDHL
jgi:S-methylmethionine-dependent homocysteine/selenocysteine methylase